MADLTGVDVAGGWSKKGSQFKICPAYCQGFLPAGDRRSQSFQLSRGQVNGCKGPICSAPRLSASFRVPTTLRVVSKAHSVHRVARILGCHRLLSIRVLLGCDLTKSYDRYNKGKGRLDLGKQGGPT